MAAPATALHVQETTPARVASGSSAWRRNLVALWFIEFISLFAFSFATPFLTIYMRKDLGVSDVRELALWTGLCGGAVGTAMAVASPIWGVIADHRGRKVMLLRAIAGGAISIGLMAIVRTPAQLFALCIVQGACSGTVAAATALVAGETPRRHVAHALSVLTSAIALGGALGPIAGGLMAGVVGLRALYATSGVLLILALVPALVGVHESPLPERSVGRSSLPSPQGLAGITRASLLAIGVLVSGQALMQFAATATGSLTVLRVMRVDPAHAGTVAGLAFGIAGLATTFAALAHEPLAKRAGYRRLVAAAAALACLTVFSAAIASSTWLLVLAVGAGGLFFGTVSPALYSMIGLEAPRPTHGTVYGISASASSLGAGAGPMVTGALAAIADVQAGLIAAGCAAGLLAALLWTAAREPRLPA